MCDSSVWIVAVVNWWETATNGFSQYCSVSDGDDLHGFATSRTVVAMDTGESYKYWDVVSGIHERSNWRSSSCDVVGILG